MTKINRGSYVLTSRSGHFQVIIIFYIIKKGRLGDSTLSGHDYKGSHSL